MHDVEHHGRRRPTGHQHAKHGRDQHGRLELEQLTHLRPDGPLLDPQLGRGQVDPAALGQRRVGLESLEPLVELRRHGDAPDECAAALAADDLARVLQALQRGAQRPARDAEHLGHVVLGWQAVAGPVAPGREPVAQRLLGAVDQRLPLRAPVIASPSYLKAPRTSSLLVMARALSHPDANPPLRTTRLSSRRHRCRR